jgi:peptidoglycan/LPS O-acetylase OafA/YrhL
VDKAHYPNFNLVRLVLAALVVAGHYAVLSGHEIPNIWAIRPVPAFVAISGFLVLPSLLRSTDWLTFAWKRVCRVVPAMLVMLTAVLVCFGWDALADTVACYASVGLIERPHLQNVVVWSLAAEEILYAAMALLASVGFYRKAWGVATWMLIGTLVMPWVLFTHNPQVIRLAWLMGCFPLGSLMWMQRERLATWSKWIWPAFLVAGFCAPALGRLTYPLMPWTLVGSAGVVGFAAFGWRLPELKLDISYGVYLFHLPVYAALKMWHLESPLVAVPLTIATAALSWYCVEKPALRLKDWKAGLPTRVAVST